MIYFGDKEITSVFLGSKIITKIYLGAKLVWEAIRSCFGAGFWKNDAPWSNIEGWKN